MGGADKTSVNISSFLLHRKKQKLLFRGLVSSIVFINHKTDCCSHISRFRHTTPTGTHPF